MCGDILVSIIVPVYNMELYLKRCVASLCTQTHQRIEIILVDDGSVDQSPALCDRLAKEDCRITVIHQENRGLGGARNSGIAAARGEWLCFVDSDDYVDADYVRTLLTLAVENDCLMAQGRYQMIFDDTQTVGQPVPETKIMDWRSFMCYICNIPGYSPLGVCTSIYHRSLFESIRFSGLRCSEDVPVTPQLVIAAREKCFAVSNQILYFYFQRPQSLSRGKRNASWLDIIPAFYEPIAIWMAQGEDVLADYYWSMYFSVLISAATECFRDMPEHTCKQNEIIHEVKKNLDRAKKVCHPDLTIPVGAREAWISFLEPERRYVLYGYGYQGMNVILPWLLYFHIPVLEIWDQRAKPGDTVDGIPFCKAHAQMEQNVTILITPANAHNVMSIQMHLRRLGYQHFVQRNVIDAAIKYAKYERFLLFLLEDNT